VNNLIGMLALQMTDTTRFSVTARSALIVAAEEAATRGARLIAVEDVLVGLLSVKNSVALAVLDRLGVPRTETADAVPDRTGSNPTSDLSNSRNGTSGLDRATIVAFRHSCEEADMLGCRYVGTEHLLLGLMRGRSRKLTTLFSRLGIHLDEARTVVRDIGVAG
jgi:ATP-dependent Clp protease ATP-binding subunit ClpA